jgi:flagellar M-ring protein FliF
MDFLAKALEQIKDVFAQMSPGSRLTTGLLVAVVVISIAYLAKFESSSADDYLFGGIPIASSDLNAVQAAFGTAELNDYETEGNRIRVPRAKRAAYMAALADANAIPAGFSSNLDELAKGSSILETGEKLRLRQQVAKQNDLANTIRKMNAVEEATVQYAEVVKGGFPRRKERTAMVAVRPMTGAELSAQQVDGIKKLVAGAYAGLSTDDVSLTDLNTGQTYAKSNNGGVPSASDDPYASRKIWYEKRWEAQIHQALSLIEGVIVTVNVELNPIISSEELVNQYDPQSVTVGSKTATQNDSNTKGIPSGRPGLQTQGPNAAAAIALPNSESTRETSSEETTAVASQTRTETRNSGLTPKEVQALISVPSSYYRRVWDNKKKDGSEPTETELLEIETAVRLNIEKSVVKILPKPPPGTAAYPQIFVSTFEHIIPPKAAPPSGVDNAFGWLADNWNSVGMTLVGAFGLLMLRSMVRTSSVTTGSNSDVAPLSETELSLEREEQAEEMEDDGDSDGASSHEKRRFKVTGPNVRDELADMVREDPDAAASILRNWIGDAA